MSIGIPRIKDVNTETLAANKTLVVGDAYYQRLDGDGARDIVLPAEAQGLQVYINNTGGETLTVKDDDSSTIVTIATTEEAELHCDGTEWIGNVNAAT